MAYRKTYIVKSLPDNSPEIESETNFNNISDSLFRNKRLGGNNGNYDLPNSFIHCQTWLTCFYETAFKADHENWYFPEFCPIAPDHFMVRYSSEGESIAVEKKLLKLIADNKGLRIDISEGG